MAEADSAIYWLNNHWYVYAGRPTGEINPHHWRRVLGDRWVKADIREPSVSAMPRSDIDRFRGSTS